MQQHNCSRCNFIAIQPTINAKGNWQIGGVDLKVKAAGESPELRVEDGMLQWKLPSQKAWRDLYALPTEPAVSGALAGVQVFLDSGGIVVVSPSAPIMFEGAWVNNNPNIMYNRVSSTFTAMAAGTYMVNYQTNVMASVIGSVELSLTVNGEPVRRSAIWNVQVGESNPIDGFALLELAEGDTVQLVNTSGLALTLPVTSPQAQMQIVGLV